MHEAYSLANAKIVRALNDGEKCLDCGAHNGHRYKILSTLMDLDKDRYHGIEWNGDLVKEALGKNLNVVQGDLNKTMNFSDESFKCIFGLSVLEHILNPCNYLNESFRCLEKGGTLVILTPNISTFFTMLLLLVGKMPSSGPHPDSNLLIRQEEILKVSSGFAQPDTKSETPIHRHLIVFSYRVLKSYLKMIGFEQVSGYGFGLYPFPNMLQPFLERIDPYHCHQMVFVARKGNA